LALRYSERQPAQASLNQTVLILSGLIVVSWQRSTLVDEQKAQQLFVSSLAERFIDWLADGLI
jgi:hypothetical protein